MRQTLRIFFHGGYFSYRALFNWQSPRFYVPTMLAGPAFQVLFFAYLGRFSHVRDDAFYVVGNAVQVSGMSGVFGVAITVGGERWTQTLAPLLANPAYFLMLLFCGVNIPLSALPKWMQVVGSGMPLTHGIAAARRVAHGASLSSVDGLLGEEALIGLCYFAVGYVLLRVFEAEGRRRATL